jgi:periplasmic divalent cation tolerance protein
MKRAGAEFTLRNFIVGNKNFTATSGRVAGKTITSTVFFADPVRCSDVRVVLCTFPDYETAYRLAREAVEQRYAACANLVPGLQSIYRWQGTVEQAAEILVIYKTSVVRYPDLEAFLLRSHPYKVPEIVALPLAAGSTTYAQWVLDNSAPEQGS